MASKACPKAGIYFSHYECFGHTSRVMAVGEVFKKRFPDGEPFFIQAGVGQPRSKIDQLGRVYSLPGAFMNRRHFRETVHGAAADADERARMCADIVSRERPDLFITEFFPFGMEECRHELISSLVKASAQGAALWAVAGYPLLTGTNHEWRQKIIKLYQRAIIFSPSMEKEQIAGTFAKAHDRRRYLDFFEQHARKIIFAGYLLPQQEVVRDDEDKNIMRPPVPKGACRVAVLRGGGAYFPKIIAQAIRASDLLGKEYYLTVVAGPATTLQEWYYFDMLAGKKKVNNLLLLRAAGNYEGLIEESDVCVSTASYHTSVMLLKHRKKAIVIPFDGSGAMSCYEQPARAALLKEMIGAEVLSIHDLTADALARAVKDAAARQKINSPVPREWFTGRDVLEQSLTGLFGQ
jgi:predicted glycosyltransferase